MKCCDIPMRYDTIKDEYRCGHCGFVVSYIAMRHLGEKRCQEIREEWLRTAR